MAEQEKTSVEGDDVVHCVSSIYARKSYDKKGEKFKKQWELQLR